MKAVLVAAVVGCVLAPIAQAQESAQPVSEPAGHLRRAVRARRLDRPDRADHRARSSSSGSASRSSSIIAPAAAA